MDELWLVVMVCPVSIGPTEAHLSVVIMGDDEEVVVNNAKVPWHDGWEKRQACEQVGCKLANVFSSALVNGAQHRRCHKKVLFAL